MNVVADLPIHVTFHELDPSPAIESVIRRKAEKLWRFFSRIVSLRVVVGKPHRHKHRGETFEIRIFVSVPGSEVVVDREPGADLGHADLRVAIDDAFRAAQRQLQSYARKMRREVKSPAGPPHGTVVHLNALEGFGFLLAPDGGRVYFHRNSVLNGGFDKLEVGEEVRFKEEHGEEGLQASTVAPTARKLLPAQRRAAETVGD